MSKMQSLYFSENLLFITLSQKFSSRTVYLTGRKYQLEKTKIKTSSTLEEIEPQWCNFLLKINPFDFLNKVLNLLQKKSTYS
jgi:hypothetical protein